MYNTPLDLLAYKNKYFGKAVFVVAAGPSAFLYQKIYDQLCISHDNLSVATIKQSFSFIRLASDFHFFNSLNCANYYPLGKPARLLSIFQDDQDMKRQFNSYDIRFEVSKNKSNPWLDCLSINHEIDKYSIERSCFLRPWGPGIMLETVFYFLNYLGFSHIYTLGFDVASSDGSYKHFYDEPKKKPSINNDTTTTNYLRHLSCLPYNTGHGPLNLEGFNETERIRSLLPVFHDWLLKNGSRLCIYTTSRYLEAFNFVHVIDS